MVQEVSENLSHSLVGRHRHKRTGEKVIEGGIALAGITAIVVLLGIFVLLLKEGIPVFFESNPVTFFTGSQWYPVSDPPTFGILSALVATILVTVTAMIIAFPVGLAAAVYLAEIAHPAVRETVKAAVELLAGVPSVVFGFIGLVVLTPVIRTLFDLPTGLTGLAAGIMLALMSLPVVISVSDDALRAVPRQYKEASYALGCNHWQTIVHVSIPAALSGITAAVMLGVGRAVGETMTVLMVAGGALSLTFNIADPMRPLTATIAAEINNAVQGGLQYHALFAVGLVLFALTFIVNLIADLVVERQKRRFS